MPASIEMRNKTTAGIIVATTGSLGGLALAEGVTNDMPYMGNTDGASAHELHLGNDEGSPLATKYQLAGQRIKEMGLIQKNDKPYRSYNPNAQGSSSSTTKTAASARLDKYRYPNKHGHPCGGNRYSHYIYLKESTCRVKAVNPGGCKGIGQACPGSKLTNVCPGLTYKCEDRFFKNYARARYGSWEKAYEFRRSHDWW